MKKNNLTSPSVIFTNWFEENVINKKFPKKLDTPIPIKEAQNAVLAALLYHTGIIILEITNFFKK